MTASSESMKTAAPEPPAPDSLLGGRISLRQSPGGYRAAIDPVVLAAAVPARANDWVADLGCGGGAASLCLLARCQAARALGLEIQPDLAALAGRNARESGLGSRFQGVCADLLQPPFGKGGGIFDHVMANPPYLPAARGRRPLDPARATANVEGAAKLPDWVAAALGLVKRRGSVTFVHRADRLDELLALMSGRLGGLVIAPLWPAAGKAAKRVIVQGWLGIATPTRLAPGLTLHRPEGGFTEPAERILRDGAPLEL